MAKEDLIQVDAIVTKLIKGCKYEVGILKDQTDMTDDKRREISNSEDAGQYITSTAVAHLGGKLRMNKITIVAGDIVTVALSPYDLTRGTIIWRYRS